MHRPQLIIILSVSALLLAGAVSLVLLWAPAGQGEVRNFSVRSGDTVSVIARHLKTDRLIRSPIGFKLYLKLTGQIIIQPGVYQLSPTYWTPKIANTIASGSTANVSATIPEGYTTQQIAELFDSKGIASQAEFLALVKSFPPDYDFLKAKPAEASLEGFLFPDTYRLIKGDATIAIRMMLDNFGVKYRDDIKNELNDKNLYEVLIIASLIEKEAKTQPDREQIAAVLYNRIEAGMRLDVDATVRYAINDWKKALTKEDLSIDSPYNTRRYGGLPPTPICNPGLASIKAAMNPPESDYYYYLTDYEGITHYAKTLAEHNANKLKYLL